MYYDVVFYCFDVGQVGFGIDVFVEFGYVQGFDGCCVEFVGGQDVIVFECDVLVGCD